MHITPYSRQRYDRLAHGWNTWNIRSVASHVFLPDCLSLSISLFPSDGTPPCHEFVWEQVDRFGEHAPDGSYTDITLKLGEIRLRVETCSEGDTLGMKVTPLLGPTGTVLGLAVAYLWDRPGVVTMTRNHILANTDGRNFTVHSSVALETPPDHPINTHSLYVRVDQRPIYFGVNRPPDPSSIEATLAHKLRSWMVRAIQADGPLGDGLDAMRRVLLWNTAFEPESRRVITPVSRGWCRSPDSFGHYVLFGWDTFFAALMLGMVDKNLAYATLSSILEEIVPEGHIPNFGSATGASRDRSEPQVGAWCAMKLYRQYGERDFLEECFDRLLQWNRWRFAARDCNNDGLLELASTPYRPDRPDEQWHKREVGGKQGAMWESGLDNHPMWDAAIFNEHEHCMELSYAGENGLMVADCHILADMATILGRTREVEELRQRGNRLAGLVNAELWSDEAGSYLNKDWTGQFNPVMGLPHFYPLIAGIVSDARKPLLMKRLTDPDEFGGPLVIPNVGRRESSFKDQNYWRGRIWGPTNFLVSEGVRRSGEATIARDLAQKSLALLVSNWRKNGRVCENYNAITGEGSEPGGGGSDPFYTWGGLLTYMAIQESFDPLAWQDGISLGNTVDGTTRLRNVPFRSRHLEFDSQGIRANGKLVLEYRANERITVMCDDLGA